MKAALSVPNGAGRVVRKGKGSRMLFSKLGFSASGLKIAGSLAVVLGSALVAGCSAAPTESTDEASSAVSLAGQQAVVGVAFDRPEDVSKNYTFKLTAFHSASDLTPAIVRCQLLAGASVRCENGRSALTTKKTRDGRTMVAVLASKLVDFTPTHVAAEPDASGASVYVHWEDGWFGDDCVLDDDDQAQCIEAFSRTPARGGCNNDETVSARAVARGNMCTLQCDCRIGGVGITTPGGEEVPRVIGFFE
jgi:hypothetical protein